MYEGQKWMFNPIPHACRLGVKGVCMLSVAKQTFYVPLTCVNTLIGILY